MGQFCNSTNTTAPNNCMPGTYRNQTKGASPNDCWACPAGQYCPLAATVTPTNCPAGTYRALVGASALSDCTTCSLGTYSPVSTGLTQDCLQCPGGSYCSSPLLISGCPANTNSAPGSSTLLNCICLPGYQCTYSQQLSLVITLNNCTVAQFNNNTNNIRSNLIAAIAAAAGVNISQVNITGVSLHSGSRRRLLGLPPSSSGRAERHHVMHPPSRTKQVLTPRPKGTFYIKLVDVHTHVRGSKRLTNLGQHLTKHKISHHSWRLMHG